MRVGKLKGKTPIKNPNPFPALLGLKLRCFRAVAELEMVYSQREHSST